MPSRRISPTMARTTTSREASSARWSYGGMKRSPAALRRYAPSPRSASVTSWTVSWPSTASPVGWNCTNSRSRIAAPARYAMAIAVAGRDRRVGGASVDLTGAAGRQDRDHRHVEGQAAVVEVQRERADAASVHGEQVDDELVLVELHAAAHAGRLGEGARHLAAGGVAAGVHHARHRVRALAAEDDLARRPCRSAGRSP